MATTTPAQSFPVMTDADDPDVPADILALALAIEKRVFGVYTTVADRTAKVPAPQEGQFAFVKDTDTISFYDGTVWKTLFVSTTYVPQITTGSATPSNATGTNGDVYLKV